MPIHIQVADGRQLPSWINRVGPKAVPLWTPLSISQILVSSVEELNRRSSGRPSLLKSETPTTCQRGGTVGPVTDPINTFLLRYHMAVSWLSGLKRK